MKKVLEVTEYNIIKSLKPSVIFSRKTKESAKIFEQFLSETNLFDLINNKGLKTIYIKPNFMTYMDQTGVNFTSIFLLRSLCQFLKRSGLSPIIVESNMFYHDVFPKHIVENVGKQLKIDFAPLLNLSTQPTIKREYNGYEFSIPAIFANPDQYYLINFPMLKGHPIFNFTCALKNLYGLFPESDKIYYFHHKMDICDAVIAINNLVHSDFTIVDAIRCQDKIHDILTTALPVKLAGYYYDYQFLFASENPLAIDMLIKDLLKVKSDCVLDSMQAIYSPNYVIKGDQPPPLKDFQISGYFKRLFWKRLTELPFSQKILHQQMGKIFRNRLESPKYKFDKEIFSF